MSLNGQTFVEADHFGAPCVNTRHLHREVHSFGPAVYQVHHPVFAIGTLQRGLNECTSSKDRNKRAAFDAYREIRARHTDG